VLFVVAWRGNNEELSFMKMELHKILGFFLVRVDSRFRGRHLGLQGLGKWPLQSSSLTARDFLWG